MSNKPKKPKRPDSSYLKFVRSPVATIKKRTYSVYDIIPSLRKYKRRKTLKSWEKSHIKRWENILRHTHSLIPTTKKGAKKNKEFLYKAEFFYKSGPKEGQKYFVTIPQALRVENIGQPSEVKFSGNARKDIKIIANGRTWIMWKLGRSDVDTQGIREAGQEAFHLRERFPIEKIAKLAHMAFKDIRPKTVYLWTRHGIVGEGFDTLSEFMQWTIESYTKYKETDLWVNGLAILIKGPPMQSRSNPPSRRIATAR